MSWNGSFLGRRLGKQKPAESNSAIRPLTLIALVKDIPHPLQLSHSIGGAPLIEESGGGYGGARQVNSQHRCQ